MCGITGWANLDPNAPVETGDEQRLRVMCGRMVHRGPDSEGIWLGPGAALGMRRLSIIDLETGDQPFWNESRTALVIMNGEIYNFRELKTELGKKGYRFKTESDTEVLPHLYDEYGADFVSRLNGMFAIALWDTKKRSLLLARDRFGEKPLYYGVFEGRLLFASEPKVLLSHPAVAAELNPEALYHYLSYDYVPAPLSIYRGIKKLPAAHALEFSAGTEEIREYWKLSFEKPAKQPSTVEAAARLSGIISDSVDIRLISDVPLGVLLSGGIDSSTVAAFAGIHSTKKIKTFSIGFEEDSFDESAHARRVSRHLGTEHHEEKLSVKTAVGLIGEIGKWLDEPLSDGSLIPTYLLSRFVRKNVTVALGGDGGDEIFAGYPMYYGHRLADLYKRVPSFVRSALIEPLVAQLPARTHNLSFDYKARRFVDSSKYDRVTRHHSWFGSFSPDEKVRLLSRGFGQSFEQTDIYDGARRLLESSDAVDKIEQMQLIDMKYYLAEDILTKVDRASMAVSLEVRAPFLDHRVAEYAASLPAGYKLRGRTTKFILKETVKEMLPKSIISRPKKGFGIPIAEWLKGPLNPLMRELLSEPLLEKQGYFDAKFVQKLIGDHEQGVCNNYKQLWNLLVFQLWHENFIGER